MPDKKDKALKLALEALEFVMTPDDDQADDYYLKAITAIREALAEQPCDAKYEQDCSACNAQDALLAEQSTADDTDATIIQYHEATIKRLEARIAELEQPAHTEAYWKHEINKARDESYLQGFAAGKKEVLKQQQATPEDLAKLGWQSIECPFCGSSGAQAFPKPAQQQEPVAWRWTNRAGWKTYGEMPHDTYQSVPLYTSPPAAQQPVAWLSTDSIGERYLCFTKPNDHDSVRPLVLGDTSPPASKPWVGLTPKDIEHVRKNVLETTWALDTEVFAYALDAKLREKNQ